jgi:hypothetical protein
MSFPPAGKKPLNYIPALASQHAAGCGNLPVKMTILQHLTG